MNLETFFEKFDQFADAPDAVARIRELVLDLAVQGKLAKQIPAEGDGHALLRQVHKKNPPSAVETDEEPVDSQMTSFPPSWALSKLGEVAHIIRGVTFPGSAKSNTRSDGDVACLRTASVQAEIDWDDLIYISPAHVSRTDQWVAPNDIMISMANSYTLVGKVAMVRQVPQKATFGAFLAAIRPVLIEPYFLLYVLRSPRMQAAFRASSSQTTNIANISLGRMRPLPFPLPPLAEQKRIVAKVDELMALCDRLEAQQQERQTRHAALARASLARFADAPTPANLHFLFHPSYAISPADLRKSVLTLAVQGKLVPQDPNDEPSSQQLETIQARKAELIRKQVIKKSDPSRPVDPDEVDHDIPDSWAWVRLVEICELITDGTHLTPKYTESGRMFLSAQNVKPFKFMPAKHRFVSEEHYQGYVKNRKPERGDVLLTRVGAGIGEAATIDQDLDFAIYVSLGLVRPVRSFVFSDYITLWLNSPDGTENSSRNTYGKGVSQGNLNLSLIRNFLVPLPPLAEQRRIVAKVEQLMALVDALETQLAASRATAEKLLAGVVAELTEGTHASPTC
jgi:type I restriction enzyme S subunit